ncbi:MAG: 3-hydroxybutyryl-CoA dehydrogenase [Acidimicrobiaceae bacterium]|jgi:3-hydroxybutyryl-CoA dehydrogenase|nr:3-hydroxybutyryl-CoA dehydrogenase [Acidimicrobiaceae bacterium]
MAFVEVIPSLRTSGETIARAESVVRDLLHKEMARALDRAGFVVNALLVPYLLALHRACMSRARRGR